MCIKNFILFSVVLLVSGGQQAKSDTLTIYKPSSGSCLEPLTPSYLEGTFQGYGFNREWFVSIQGGASAFAGTPQGCGDLFQRTDFLLNASIGKWITPRVGARVSYQGLRFIGSDLESHSFSGIHLDLMYNLVNSFYDENSSQRWRLFPFIGAGMLHSGCDTNPFALSYGIGCQYRLSNRLWLSAEIANSTTFQNFDGIGSSTRLGDHLIQASVGFHVTLGRPGWKRVIDALPYMRQNDLLLLSGDRPGSQGWLANVINDSSEDIVNGSDSFDVERNGLPSASSAYRRNDYSGLNSLRSRLNAAPSADNKLRSVTDSLFAGIPVCFFFQLNTAKLTDNSQLLNVMEIAKVAKSRGFRIRVIGAADSDTGSDIRNRQLSQERAEYISEQLKIQGVPADSIECSYLGGISKYSPAQVNRLTRVFLIF